MFSQTQQSYSMLFIDLGRHVSIRLESPAGPLQKTTHPLHGNIKTRYGIPKVHNQFIFAIYICLCFVTILSGYNSF